LVLRERELRAGEVEVTRPVDAADARTEASASEEAGGTVARPEEPGPSEGRI
jgi:hypothetical protein